MGLFHLVVFPERWLNLCVVQGSEEIKVEAIRQWCAGNWLYRKKKKKRRKKEGRTGMMEGRPLIFSICQFL